MSEPSSGSRSSDSSLMFPDSAIINATEICEANSKSVLYKLRSAINGQGVVDAVVKSLVTGLNVLNTNRLDGNIITSEVPVDPTTSTSLHQTRSFEYLENDGDVQWVMEVICYGLSLPISTTEQHEGVRDCVKIYCEWMFAVLPLPKTREKIIPVPVRNDPNRYFRLIIHHLYNVFIRRPNLGSTSYSNNRDSVLGSGNSNSSLNQHGHISGTSGNSNNRGSQDANPNDILSRQAVLCHRILRTLEAICAENDNLLDRESWETILIFLLGINDTLLSGPVDREDIGTNLCERIVKSIFEIWLISCNRCFPSPPFWKTFHELCLRTRHRTPVIDTWSSVCLSLTQRLVVLSNNGSSMVNTNVTSPVSGTGAAGNPSSSSFSVLPQMTYECVSQTWYRFLHMIGNPLDLCFPDTPLFHDLLATKGIAPENFKRVMRGVSQLINTFLGVSVENAPQITSNSSESTLSPPIQRRPSSTSTSTKQSSTSTKSHSLLTTLAGRGGGGGSSVSTVSTSSSTTTLVSGSSGISNNQAPVISHPTPVHLPNVSSADVYNSWKQLSSTRPKVNSILNCLGNWLFSASLIGSELQPAPLFEDKQLSCIDGNTLSNNKLPTSNAISRGTTLLSEFEAGQAEAVGILCRLLSSKRTDEDVYPLFLARFYLVIQTGLSVWHSSSSYCLRPLVLTSILTNSTKLFQSDLNGVNILIPHFLKALEWVTSEHRSSGPNQGELRRACVSIISSLLPYPLHFKALPIKDCLTDTSSVTTFQSLRPRLLNILMNALRTESDSQNAQLLLVGLLTCVQDLAHHELATMSTNTNESGINDAGGDKSDKKTSPFQRTVSLDSTDSSKDSSIAREGIPDTAVGLLIRALQIVCHNLKSTWRNDSPFSLTALEVLSGLARVKLNFQEGSVLWNQVSFEYKHSVDHVCEYIVNQCSRPPPSHSKDLHSTIVAAYQCLSVCFQQHPHLLLDGECVTTVLEVIELGISGSKSRVSPSNGSVVTKGEKQLKPASMRVKEAAESLLSCVMNHIGSLSSSSMATTSSSFLLDEVTLLKHYRIAHVTSPDEAIKYFRYFVSDNNIIFAILKETTNSNTNRETLIIIRSPFGKYCWSLTNQLLPLYKSSSLGGHNEQPDVIPRPPPAEHSVSKLKFPFKYFPDVIERIAVNKLDLVVPSLESVVAPTPEMRANHDILRKSLERQCLIEREAQQKIPLKSRPKEWKEPPCSSIFDPVRLILTHFGLLSDAKGFLESPRRDLTSALVALDNKHIDLWTNLKTLDLISTRTSDTVFIFYARKGRSDPQEILNSVSSKHYVTQVFLDFLHSLGNVIDIRKHTGWTGNVGSSWKTEEETPAIDDFGDPGLDHGGCVYNGQRKAIYWSDVSHEMVFVVPSGRLTDDDLAAASFDNDSRGNRSGSNVEALSTSGRSMSSDEGTSVTSSSKSYSDTSSRTSLRNKGKQLSLLSNIGCDTKILVIWLESADDTYDIPINSLLMMTRTGTDLDTSRDYFVLFIHPLKNGLFKMKTLSSPTRSPFSVPLTDGVVINRRLLGPFVRMTTLNYCRRRRLDAESYQPAHVKRRLKIQEMTNKLKLQNSPPDFFTSIFF